jgi:Tol biopolymer transport system component
MFSPNTGARALCALLALACTVARLPVAAAQNPVNLITFHSDRDGDWEIYVMNADGTGQRALTQNTVEDREPVWSPDGRTIAFTSRRDGNIEIYVARSDGSGLRRLTTDPASDFLPSFSPDGKQIAFVSDRARQTDIYLVNVDGSNLRRFTSHDADEWRPMWSPDGRQIAFLSGRDGGQSDGSGEIYVRDVAGSPAERRLINATRRVNSFAWSPDSARIVYYMVAARKLEIGVAGRTGDDERNLSAVASSGMDSEPSWSPDGKQIAFLSGTQAGTMGVFVMAADGSGRRMISAPETPVTGPLSWSPDGRGIAHVQTIAGNLEIVVSHVDGTPFRRLTTNSAADQAASFARRSNSNTLKSAVTK